MGNVTLQARHLGFGALVYAVVSGLWVVLANIFGSAQSVVLTAIGVVLIAVMVVYAVRFISQTPKPIATEDDKTGMWFGIIFAWEGIGIGVASGILAGLGLADWIGVAIVIIVGLHFFPLARLFDIRTDYAIGAVLIVLGIATPLLVSEPSTWFDVIGYGAALTLYAAGWARILLGQRIMNS